ncbi:MAG TPA: hypothetical protein VD948_07795, partial [Rhodothermales bacterium]|nr:hypothetical protein [Rhodothermales bacterium]
MEVVDIAAQLTQARAAKGGEVLSVLPAWNVHLAPGEAVVFSDAPDFRIFRGPLAVALARALAVPRRSLELAFEAAGAGSAAEALWALDAWQTRGLVAPASSPSVRPGPTDWPEKWSVSGIDLAPSDVDTLRDELGPRIDAGAAPLHVVFVRDYLDPAVAEALGQRSGVPTVLVRPVGAALWVGPYLRGDEVGAYVQLAERLRRVVRLPALLAR